MRIKHTIFAALASTLVLAACSSGSDEPAVSDVDPGSFPANSTMARLAEDGKITVGTKFDQPLFGLKAPNGDPEGFDVEIAKIIAGELGISADNITWVQTVSANRETFIEQGQVDFVVATYTINDKRKEVVDFGGPYYIAGQSLMVLKDNSDINGPEDLDGKKVCSVDGSTPAQNIAENYPQAELVTLDTYTDCLDPLRNKQVDAVTTDNVILAGYVAESEDEFRLAGEQFTEEPYGIGLKKGDTDFRNFINDTLEKSFDDGRWETAWQDTAGQVLPLPDPPVIDRY
ncbi:glutamate ABC transporter substrate-binding protein [Timonella sp. A28]|uniref:glutamate ABC transporter substrate-binding protein n=1 Tax=Timonella sp. A28 TaxID=3442640 RepID=UPI003EC045BE